MDPEDLFLNDHWADSYSHAVALKPLGKSDISVIHQSGSESQVIHAETNIKVYASSIV